MRERRVLRGAQVVPMDGSRTEFGSADVLLEGDRVRAIAPRLGELDAEQFDLSGTILLPGLIDTHRHLWQTSLRGLGSDWSVLDYLAAVRMKLAPVLSPDDVFAATLAGGLEALECGVTTLVDHAHGINTPAHADAAYAGLVASGLRAVFCYGLVANGPACGGHAQRLADAHLFLRSAREPRVRVGAALSEMQIPWHDTCAEVALARRHAAPITFHSTAWPMPGESEITRLSAAGLLGADMLLSHCTHADQRDLGRLAAAGCALASTPETELQMGMGLPALGRARSEGVRVSLGADVACSNNGDPFALMRLALQVTRGLEHARAGLPETLTLRAADALAWMTCDAADALGMPDVGRITVGARADLVVLAGSSLTLEGVSGAALVTQAHAGHVRDVLVAGQFVKRAGVLCGAHVERARSALRASRVALLARSGGRDALLSELPALRAHWNVGQREAFAGSAG